MRNSKTDFYQFIKGVIILGERGAHKNCTLCSKPFSTFNKEHQCKRCKRPVCNDCSKGKYLLPDDQKMHRQCNNCKEEISRLKTFLQEYKICFLVDTFSSQWLKNFGVTLQQAKNVTNIVIKEFYDEQYQAKEKTDLSEYNVYKSQQAAVLKEIQQGQNYSLRDFFAESLKQNSQERVLQQVEQVLEVFLKQYPEIGYQADLVILTMFLLFFASVPSTYALLKIIYFKVFPQYLWFRQLRLSPYKFREEVQNIQSINAKMNKTVSQDFLENRIYRYICPLTVNLFIFEVTFHILDEMFTSNQPYQQFLRSLSMAMSLTNTEIGIMGINHQLGELIILRKVEASLLQNMVMKTRSMSISISTTPLSSNSLQRKGSILLADDDMKTSQILTLKSEITYNKNTMDSLLAQIEKLNFQNSNYQDQIDSLKKKIQNYEQEVKKLNQIVELQNQNQDVNSIVEMRNSYENAAQEIQNLSNQVEELKTINLELTSKNTLYIQENELLKSQLKDLKQVQFKYGAVDMQCDPIFMQDVKDIEAGLDFIHKSLFKGIIDLVFQQQADLKYKDLELQLRKDEVIANPVLEKLRSEMMELEEELSKAMMQNSELKQQLQQKNLISNQRKQISPRAEQQLGCGPNSKDCKLF